MGAPLGNGAIARPRGGVAGDSDPAPSSATSPASLAVAAACGIVLAAALLFSGGVSEERLAVIGGVAVALAGLAWALAALGGVPRARVSREGGAFFLFLAGLVAWSGASIVWSITPESSWSAFNRSLVYLAFAALGLVFAGAVAKPFRLLATGLAALLGVVLAWALAEKVVPPEDAGLLIDLLRDVRLEGPIGYANALALVSAMALPLALWVASDSRHAAAARAGGVLLVYAPVVALVLTYSRGGIMVAALAVALWLLLTPSRLERVLVLAVALAVAVPVLAVAFALPGVTAEEQPRDVRVDDGVLFGVALVVGAAIVFAAAFVGTQFERRRRLSDAERRRVGRALVALAALALAAAMLALVIRVGDPVEWGRAQVDRLTSETYVGGGPGRLADPGTNQRWEWWQDAFRSFEDEPVFGTGAGSFALAQRTLPRHAATRVTEPHNLFLEFLAETGLVGAALLVGAAGAAALAVRGAFRRAAADERPAVAALAVGVAAFALHSLLDVDWEFLALGAPVFFVLGALASAGAGGIRRRARAPILAAASVVLAAASLWSLGSPWLADRLTDEALELRATSPDEAVDKGRRAKSLDPLSLDARWALAAAYSARGDRGAARSNYLDAAAIEPRNPDAWYELACFELAAGEGARGAVPFLARAASLDPEHPASELLADARHANANRVPTC